MKVGHPLIPHTRINSKWMKDLNVIPNTIQILEENISSKISDIAQITFYLIYLPRQGKQKKNISKGYYIKLKGFWTAKEISNKIKRQPTEWENTFANKWSISKIYKKLTKLNTKKKKPKKQTNNNKKTIQLKMGKDLNRHFSKEDIQMANRHVKIS